MTDSTDLDLARAGARAAYRSALARLAQILFEEDPIGLNVEDNTDEYEPEAGTILPKLRRCESVEDVERAIYLDFVRWFDHRIAGSPENYRRAAERVWIEMRQWNLPGSEGRGDP